MIMKEPKALACVRLWLFSFISVYWRCHAKLVTYAHFTLSSLHDIIHTILALEGLLASGYTMREVIFKKL